MTDTSAPLRPRGMPSTLQRARFRLADRAAARLLASVLAALICVTDVVPASGADETALAEPSGGSAASCATGTPMLDTTFGRSILTGIVTKDGAAWAVGMTTLSEDPRYALAVRWDGSAWPVMSMRRPKAEQALFAIDRGPGGSLWAAGYRSSAGGYRPLLMRLSQGRWLPTALGNAGRKTGVLTGVVAVTDRAVWAVGYRGARGGQRPFALRHAPSGWSEDDPPLAGGSDGALMDVDSAPGGQTWTVGWSSLRGTPHPYAARRVKGRWQVIRPPLRHASEGVLTSVAVERGGKAWAVGYRIAGGRYVPLVERWTGSRWRSVSFPTDGDAITLLRAVQLDAEQRPIVAGTRWDAATGGWRGVVGRYLDGAWTIVDAPELQGGSELRDVAEGPDGEVLAVGANGRSSLTFGVCPGDAVVAPEASPPTAGPPAPVGTNAPSVPARTTPPTRLPGATSAPTASAAPTPSPGVGRRPPKQSPLPKRRGGYRVIARDVAASVGLDRKATSTYGGVKVDIDGDAWPDLLVGRHSDAAWLLMNRGAPFSMAKGVTFPGIDRHGCTAGDANGDGRPDLFCATGALHGAGVKTDELWIQQEDGTFRDEAIALHAADPVGRGRLATFFDLDHDRYADLFIANRPDRTDGLPSRHRILANPHGDGYEPRSVLGIDAASGADCVVPADLDRDGWDDIVLRAGHRSTRRPGIRVLRNVKGKLVDVTGRWASRPRMWTPPSPTSMATIPRTSSRSRPGSCGSGCDAVAGTSPAIVVPSRARSPSRRVTSTATVPLTCTWSRHDGTADPRPHAGQFGRRHAVPVAADAADALRLQWRTSWPSTTTAMGSPTLLVLNGRGSTRRSAPAHRVLPGGRPQGAAQAGGR
ncbi:MAG: VCBS repeat-containing protein [Chloroflexota bacterium]